MQGPRHRSRPPASNEFCHGVVVRRNLSRSKSAPLRVLAIMFEGLYRFSLTATHRGQGIPRISSAAQPHLTDPHRSLPVRIGIIDVAEPVRLARQGLRHQCLRALADSRKAWPIFRQKNGEIQGRRLQRPPGANSRFSLARLVAQGTHSGDV